MTPSPTSTLARRQHRTPVEHVEVAGPWTALPALGVEVSSPLVDTVTGHGVRYARLAYRDALAYCEREDVAMLSADALELVREALPVIRPAVLPALPYMGSVEWSRTHDAIVAARLAEAGVEAACGIGKHWVSGAPSGRSHLMGWWVDRVEAYGSTRTGPGWVQPRPALGSLGAHDDTHHDYATTTLVMRPLVHLDAEPLVRPVRAALDVARRLFLGDGPIESAGAAIVRVAASHVGVREATGRNDGAAVAQFFVGCTRRVNGVERPTGWASGWDWCAAFASWCVHVALGLPVGSVVPVGRRIAVRELVEDARACGRLETSRLYRPRPGDLYIGARGGGDPLLGGTGHVRIVAGDRGPAQYVGIGGNEGNGVRESVHRYDDATWRAWVRAT